MKRDTESYAGLGGGALASGARVVPQTAFGCVREAHGNRYVYTVMSPRARGLSVGINLNPNKECNFQCVYCEVNRNVSSSCPGLSLPIVARELDSTLELVCSGRIRQHAQYQSIPESFLQVRQVCLSGDGEPTLCPKFLGVVEAVARLRARGRFPAFTLVLVTNGSGLDRPGVQQGLNLFEHDDEVWVKVEAGTQEYMNRVNHPDCSLDELLGKILHLARRRPVIIQSLFPALDSQGPSPEEVEAYARRLRQLKEAGARLAGVQICSATRPAVRSECTHLSLRDLSAIARKVREIAEVKTEVF